MSKTFLSTGKKFSQSAAVQMHEVKCILCLMHVDDEWTIFQDICEPASSSHCSSLWSLGRRSSCTNCPVENGFYFLLQWLMFRCSSIHPQGLERWREIFLDKTCRCQTKLDWRISNSFCSCLRETKLPSLKKKKCPWTGSKSLKLHRKQDCWLKGFSVAARLTWESSVIFDCKDIVPCVPIREFICPPTPKPQAGTYLDAQ